MNQTSILKELKQKLRDTYWKLLGTDEDWRRQLIQNELQFLNTSINYMETYISKKKSWLIRASSFSTITQLNHDNWCLTLWGYSGSYIICEFPISKFIAHTTGYNTSLQQYGAIWSNLFHFWYKYLISKNNWPNRSVLIFRHLGE